MPLAHATGALACNKIYQANRASRYHWNTGRLLESGEFNSLWEITLISLQLGDVGHIIQLAIAPVFLLAGVGTTLMVLTNRLARIIDRSRVLEDLIQNNNSAKQKPGLRQELHELYERAHLINRAITLGTSCGLLICLVIASLFLGDAMGLGLDKLIAALFVGSILSLVGSYSFFLREIFVATKTLTRQRQFGSEKEPR
jgi:hypothetical protein